MQKYFILIILCSIAAISAFAKPTFASSEDFMLIGGWVWQDADGNGSFELGEFPLNDVEIYLYGPDGSLLDNTTSSFIGLYSFSNFDTDSPEGTYTVSICNETGSECGKEDFTLTTPQSYTFDYVSDSLVIDLSKFVVDTTAIHQLLDSLNIDDWNNLNWDDILVDIQESHLDITLNDLSLSNWFDESVLMGLVDTVDNQIVLDSLALNDLLDGWEDGDWCSLVNLDTLDCDTINWQDLDFDIDFDQNFLVNIEDFNFNDWLDNWLIDEYIDTLDNYITLNTSSFINFEDFNFGFIPADNIQKAVELWPGDTDNDGTVQMTDLLKIGVGYNTEGVARLDQDIEWRRHQATAWTYQFLDGIDYVFADCNGDGIINEADIDAIEQNLGETHGKTSSVTVEDGPTLSFDFPEEEDIELIAGEEINLPILLGDIDLPVNQIYGLTFDILYDATLLKENSIEINFDNSWMGKDAKLLHLSKDHYEAGRFSVGVTRTNQNDISNGHGEVAEMSFVLTDDLAGKTNDGEVPFLLKFANVNAITIKSTPVELATEDVETVIITNIRDNNRLMSTFSLYPNPACNNLYLDVQDHLPNTMVKIYSLTGELIKTTSIETGQVGVSDLETGIYFITIPDKKGIEMVKKFEVIR